VTENLPARRQAQPVSLDDITDLDQALRFCDVISQSGLLPAALRGKPANVLHLHLMAREMGMSLVQAAREIYFPAGGQPQLRGRYLLARLRKAGHDYWWEETAEGCTFFIKRGDNPRNYSATFTIADALTAGLVAEQDGEIVALSYEGKPMPWQLWQKDMLFWRAAARAVGRSAPEVAMGFDLMEAAPPQDPSPQGPPPSPGGPAPAAAAGAAPAPSPPASEPGPSPALVAELQELDKSYRGPLEQAETRGDAVAAIEEDLADMRLPGPASREEQQRLSEEFARFGWLPRKHKTAVLEACTAFCGRPILAASDLTSDEVSRMVTDMATVKGADTEAGPVALADRVEVWRQKVREADPDLAGVLFGG